MFKEFIDFIWEVWEWVTPVFIVKPDEGGVKVTYWFRLREGWWKPRLLRPASLEGHVTISDVGPGLYFKVPLISHWIVVSTLTDTMQIGPLSLTSADGVDYVAVAVLEYQVKNARPMCIEVNDEKAALRNSACAALRRHLSGLLWTDMHSLNGEFDTAVLNDIRTKRASRWGFKLTSFDIITLCKMKSYRHLIDYGAGGGENGHE